MARLDDPVRLDALDRSGLLTRPVNARLQHLIFTAATLTRAEAAMLNVLDERRQHHVSQWPPIEPPPPIPAVHAGCKEVVRLEGTVVVDDATEHPIMCELPWAHHWRGYLGTPVCYEEAVIGSLCVLTRQPRRWKPTDSLTLEGLARLIGMALD